MAQLHPRARGELGLQPPCLLTGTASRKERQQKTTRATKSGHTQAHLRVEHRDLSHTSGKHTKPIPASRRYNREFCH